jgi:hypothetical protein
MEKKVTLVLPPVLKARRKGLPGKPLGTLTTRAQLLLSKRAEGGSQHPTSGKQGLQGWIWQLYP